MWIFKEKVSAYHNSWKNCTDIPPDEIEPSNILNDHKRAFPESEKIKKK